MKLIEVSKLIENINNSDIELGHSYFRLIDLINNQTVAYDIDEVCKQIKKQSKTISYTTTGMTESHTETVSSIQTDKALDIVKNGGATNLHKPKTLTATDILEKFDFNMRRAYGIDEIKKIVEELFD